MADSNAMCDVTASGLLTAEAIDAWARSNIKNVTFLFVTSDQTIAHTNDLKLEEPYEGVKTIEETRLHHICVFTGSRVELCACKIM